MKILYVANERNPAQLAANALRTLGEDVRVEWASDLSQASSWVYYNRDVAAVVVETELKNQSCAAFVDHVRSLGLVVPMIVVCPDDVRTPLLALKAGADDYVANNQSLVTDLPGVVAGALQRVQATAPLTGKRPLRLLYVGDAALARRCLENSAWSIDISEPERTSNGTFQPIPPASAAGGDLPFDVLLVEHDHPEVDAVGILKEIVSRRSNVRVILVVEWDEKLAIPAMKLGASDCVVKAADTFRALFYKLDRTRAEVALLQERSILAAEEAASRESLERQVREAHATALETQRRFDNAAAHAAEAGRIRRTLEEKLAAAEAALAESEHKRAVAAAESADHLAKRSAEHRTTLAESLRARDALKLRDALEQQLREAAKALEAARRERASESATAADHLARREAELNAALEQAATMRQAVEQKLADAEATLQRVEMRASADRAAASKEAAERHAALEERLVQEAARYRALERQLRQAAKAVEEELVDADAALEESERQRDALTQQVSQVSAALEEARQAAAADANAVAERFRRREVELGATISEATIARTALETQLTETQNALQHAGQVGAALEQQLRDVTAALEGSRQQRETEAALAAGLLERHKHELGAALAAAIASRDALAQQLVDAKNALDGLEKHAVEERVNAAREASQRKTEFDALVAERQALSDRALSEAAATVDALRQQVCDLTAALEDTRQRHVAEAAAASDRLARREAELGATIQEGIGARQVLEQQLADAETSRQQLERQHTSELAAAAARLAERQAEHEEQLAQGGAARTALETQLTETETALQRARQHAAAADLAAAQQAAQHQAAAERHASEIASASAQFEAEAAAASDRLARREVELGATIQEGIGARQVLEQQLADAETSRQQLERQHTSELAAAAARFAERQAEHEEQLAQAGDARTAVETQLTETETALQRARQHAAAADLAAAQQAAQHQAAAERHASEIASARAQLEAEVAAATDHLARREAELGATIREGIGARQVLEQQLADAAARFAERQAEHEEQLAQAGAARETLEQRLRDVTAALAEAIAGRDALGQQLVDAKSAFDELENDAAEERLNAAREASQRKTEFDALVAEREAEHDAQLQRLTEAHNEARHSHERARAASEDEHRRLSAEHASLQETLGRLRTQFEALERVSAAHAAECARLDGVVAERDAQLNDQAARHQASQDAAQRVLTQALAERDESRADIRRLFEHSPVGQFRCDRDGTLKQINRAFVGLLGYRTGDALRQVDFAKTVFESADDLQWLIERCLNSGTAETIETTWRTENGRRIVVKLVGVAASPDSIEIVVEDVTEIRELEERLRRAQLMEAVGRLASEVAATCDNLLRDVSQDGQQWLAAMHDDTVLRHQGEMLLGEVTRAASFLRQLSVYGDKQRMALGPVSVQRILRDLEPVLKRVAGDNIELVLPKPSPLNVDVEPERVERVFVNVASYARERMPHGGRLNIELATAVVDRRFVAKYPNVRPGDHVIITITELTGTVHTGPLTGPPDDSIAASRSAPEKPGVDLGALLSLVGDCGGHLWMSAEPPGNMVLKIHLPRSTSDGQQDRHAPVPRPDQRRTRARWFRH